jgi:voltage-gated potassium channel
MAGLDEGPSPEPPLNRGVHRRPRSVRRVPKPRLSGALDSPVRNLILGIAFTVSVMLLAIAGYMTVGWSLRDAVYMVIITVFTVGYDEVRPIDTPALSAITMGLIMLGCTGIIFLTGALVQFFTLNQLSNATGQRRMNKLIDQLEGHVVVCGFGRLGAVLARALSASSAGLVILEDNQARAAEAQA